MRNGVIPLTVIVFLALTSGVALSSEADDGPLLAVVIDDWGYTWDAADDFLSFDRPLTVAVLPDLAMSQKHAEAAHARGHEVILHLPMEPLHSGWDIGPRGVTAVLADDAIRRRVAEALVSIPHVSGVNNHMGSKATADRRVMESVLDVVSQHGLFFLDSVTTADTVVAEVAEKMDVPFLINDGFIDTEPKWQTVRDRLVTFAQRARRCGYSVVIGHVHRHTFRGLMEALPLVEAEGVRLARLSDVLQRRGHGCL